MRSHFWEKLSVSQPVAFRIDRSLRSWDQPHSTLRKAMPWDCLMSSWHPVRVNCSTVGKPLIGGRREARVTFSLRSTGLEQRQHACKYRENLFVPRLEGSRWTVIAEKLEAIVQLGRINSRLKDYFDLWILLNSTDTNLSDVSPAISATFTRRGTAIPLTTPVGLSREYAEDPRVVAQWRAFVTRNQLSAPSLVDVISQLREIVIQSSPRRVMPSSS